MCELCVLRFKDHSSVKSIIFVRLLNKKRMVFSFGFKLSSTVFDSIVVISWLRFIRSIVDSSYEVVSRIPLLIRLRV